MKSGVVFLIDGAYLSYISKFLGNGRYLKFELEDFVLNISKRLNVNCEIVHFYTAPPYQSPIPTEKENKRKANYDRFIVKLRGIKKLKIIIREGRCQKIRDEYSQKGVDTLITMDLLKLAINPTIDKILLMTSDTDFVPIINDVLKTKEVVLLYFTDKKRKSGFTLSNHLWSICKNKLKIILKDFAETKQ